MKAILTFTSRGVVTLPAKLRAAPGLKPDDHLLAETTPEGEIPARNRRAARPPGAIFSYTATRNPAPRAPAP